MAWQLPEDVSGGLHTKASEAVTIDIDEFISHFKSTIFVD